MNKKTYLIGDIPLTITSEKEIFDTPAFLPFIYNGKGKLDYKFIQTKNLELEGERVFDDGFVDVRKINGDYSRIFSVGRMKEPYCISNDAICYFLGEKSSFFRFDKDLFIYAGIERMLIKFGRAIFHSSLVKTADRAILFSGQSGQGKTTQAKLWENFENAEIINGDKSVITAENGKVTGYGFPYDGSSKIYKNEKTTVTAIVFPQHCKSNNVTRLSPKEAYFRIYSQLIVNRYDTAFIKIADKIVTEIVENIPVYVLQCTPDERAVECLKNALEKSL